MPNKIRDVLGIVVNVRLVPVDGKELIEIHVEAYPSPISYKSEYHLRSGSTKQELRGAALDRFLLRKQGRAWDAVPVPHVAVGDLSSEAIGRFRKLAARSQRLDAATLQEPDTALLRLRTEAGNHHRTLYANNQAVYGLLRYGTVETPEKMFLKWKEDETDDSRFKLDKQIQRMFTDAGEKLHRSRSGRDKREFEVATEDALPHRAGRHRRGCGVEGHPQRASDGPAAEGSGADLGATADGARHGARIRLVQARVDQGTAREDGRPGTGGDARVPGT